MRMRQGRPGNEAVPELPKCVLAWLRFNPTCTLCYVLLIPVVQSVEISTCHQFASNSKEHDVDLNGNLSFLTSFYLCREQQVSSAFLSAGGEQVLPHLHHRGDCPPLLYLCGAGMLHSLFSNLVKNLYITQ